MIKQVQEWRDEAEGKREEKTAVLSEHVSTCVCVCDTVSRSETRLIRFCLIGAAPHGRVRQPFPKATPLTHTYTHTPTHTHTHTPPHTHTSSSAGPDRQHEKLRLRSPSCCPELPTERPRNQAVRTTERETKREKAKREPPSLSESVDALRCIILSGNLNSAVQMYNLFMVIKKAKTEREREKVIISLTL